MTLLEVKPRFKLSHRMAGRYYWEPVNDEARALMMTDVGHTRVGWFWGDGTDSVALSLRADERARELGLTMEAYREHVRARAVETRELAEVMVPLTEEELEEILPARMRREMDREHLQYLAADVCASAGGVLPAPVPAGDPILLSAGHYEVPELLEPLDRSYVVKLSSRSYRAPEPSLRRRLLDALNFGSL